MERQRDIGSMEEDGGYRLGGGVEEEAAYKLGEAVDDDANKPAYTLLLLLLL